MPIVETTRYWAIEGQADAVLALRREVSEARRRMGLDAGNIRVRHDGGEGPDVSWTASFSDEAAYDADVAARAGNVDFSSLRDRMAAITDRFERLIEETVDDRASSGEQHLARG